MDNGRAVSFVFVAAVFSTFFCAAVNGYTYQIAYPLWRYAGREQFASLHREYLRRLWPVITLPHVAMFFTTGALLWRRPALFGFRAALATFCLGLAVILLSAGVAGPVHERFGRQGHVDEPGMRLLLRVSAVRVILMFAASTIFAQAIYRCL